MNTNSFSPDEATISRATLSTRRQSCSILKGFAMKSLAPSFIASTAASTLVSDEMKTTRRAGLIDLASFNRRIPLIIGMTVSVTRIW